MRHADGGGTVALDDALIEADLNEPGFARDALPALLYAAYERDPSVFHDVTRGGNLLHDATVGWDYATGLGTPRVAPLAELLVEMLR